MKREELKGLHISIKEVNEEFGRKMNQDVSWNIIESCSERKWIKGNGRKVESFKRIGDRTMNLAVGEDDV